MSDELNEEKTQRRYGGRRLRERVISKLGGEPVPEENRTPVTYPPEIGDPEVGTLRSVEFWSRPFAGQIMNPKDFTIVAWDRQEGELIWATEDSEEWEGLRSAVELNPRRYDAPPQFREEIFEVLEPIDIAIRWLQCRGVEPTFEVQSERDTEPPNETSP